MPVADGDGEPSEVCADHADLAVKAGPVAVLARDGHVLALAPVVRLVQGAVGPSPCKTKKKNVLFKSNHPSYLFYIEEIKQKNCSFRSFDFELKSNQVINDQSDKV